MTLENDVLQFFIPRTMVLLQTNDYDKTELRTENSHFSHFKDWCLIFKRNNIIENMLSGWLGKKKQTKKKNHEYIDQWNENAIYSTDEYILLEQWRWFGSETQTLNHTEDL